MIGFLSAPTKDHPVHMYVVDSSDRLRSLQAPMCVAIIKLGTQLFVSHKFEALAEGAGELLSSLPTGVNEDFLLI